MSDSDGALEDTFIGADDLTSAQCAEKALRALGKPSSIQEIYDSIISRRDYKFQTPVPLHVLRTSIRRHTAGADRSDMSSLLIFEEPEREIYWLMNTAPKKRTQIGMRRVQRARDKEGIIERLTADGTGPFREKWRLLLFAAALGFKLGRREPLLDVDTGRGIDQSSFSNASAWLGSLYLMGLVDTSSTELLVSSEEAESARIQMFEEFANGGLAYLKERCGDKEADLDFILDVIADETGENAPLVADLSITI